MKDYLSIRDKLDKHFQFITSLTVLSFGKLLHSADNSRNRLRRFALKFVAVTLQIQIYVESGKMGHSTLSWNMKQAVSSTGLAPSILAFPPCFHSQFLSR